MNHDEPQHDLFDRLADDFIERLRNGETVDPETYAGFFPDLADEIRELFPQIAELEKLKQQPHPGSARSPIPTALERLSASSRDRLRRLVHDV